MPSTLRAPCMCLQHLSPVGPSALYPSQKLSPPTATPINAPCAKNARVPHPHGTAPRGVATFRLQQRLCPTGSDLSRAETTAFCVPYSLQHGPVQPLME